MKLAAGLLQSLCDAANALRTIHAPRRLRLHQLAVAPRIAFQRPNPVRRKWK